MLQFCRKLRSAIFFSDFRKESTVILDASNPDDGNNERNGENEQYNYDDNKPWTKRSKFNPTPGRNEALEKFISELENLTEHG